MLQPKTRTHIWVNWACILALVLNAVLVEPAFAQSSVTETPTTGLEQSVTQAIEKHLGTAPQYGLVLDNLRVAEGWAFGTVGVIAPPIGGAGPEGFVFIAQLRQGAWQAALDAEPLFADWALLAPDGVVDAPLRAIFAPEQPQGDGSAQLSLPWAIGQTWYFTGGPHANNGSGNRPFSALDFNKGGYGGEVVAAQPGVAYRPCANFVLIVGAGGWRTGYYHLADIGVSNGQAVNRGQFLGKTSTAVGCGGSATGPHVHFSLRKNSNSGYQEITGHDIGGWTIETTNRQYSGCMSKNGSRQCAGSGRIYSDGSIGSGTPPVVCPTGGYDVILYRDWNYQCAQQPEGVGFVTRNGTGYQNLPDSFNDQASSIYIRPDWSVALYESKDRQGAMNCLNGSDDNFAGNFFIKYFFGIPYPFSVDNQVSSIEVFRLRDCGQPHDPDPPVLISPGNRAEFTGAAPTLCWRGGDLDGDLVGYQVEVFSGNQLYASANLNAKQTCWRPGGLDNLEREYSWWVWAFDTQLRTTTSDVQRFRVKDPPPVIHFQRANGQTFSGSLDSRQQDWTFAGIASDNNQVVSVRMICQGDACGSGSEFANGTTSWSLNRSGMWGRNEIYFVARDEKGNLGYSQHLDLRIDLAAPRTSFSLNQQSDPNQWPEWFTTPVTVRFWADDQATGRARSGMGTIYYRLNGGNWQTTAGSEAALVVSQDGVHTVEYYGVDRVGNTENVQSVRFKVDQTPPSLAGRASETNGSQHNLWQNLTNTPTFSWSASSDPLSGVWGYQLYFGPDAQGVDYHTFLAAAERLWMPEIAGVRTGTYYLRGRVRDVAGNWSAWNTMFIFRYDGTPPENPQQVQHTQGIKHDTWQITTTLAAFTWPVPYDEGSGIQGYRVAWGLDPNGVGEELLTSPAFTDDTPLCAANEACVGYLRLRSQDRVGNLAEDWTTAFVLRYDGVPPVVDFSVNGGITETNQTLITLNLVASDAGSGVKQMRFSGDGKNWTDWEAFYTERDWILPAIGRQSWPVYVQVKDAVGLVSAVTVRDVHLEVNRRQPRSENFRLFTTQAGAGSGFGASGSYQNRATVGQIFDAPFSSSASYQVSGGYGAASQAIPIQEPGHDEFILISGVFSSGPPNTVMSSSNFQLKTNLGEPGLPNNQLVLGSEGFRLQPGFFGAEPTPKQISLPTPPPPPLPPPPEATPACAYPQVSINKGAAFTRATEVLLEICAPHMVEMSISNFSDFAGAVWEPYAETKLWSLSIQGQEVAPRFVYLAFKDAAGNLHTTYFDEIVYDPTPPRAAIEAGEPGSATLRRSSPHGPFAGLPILRPNADGSVDIFVSSADYNSGVDQMQISASADFSGAAWEDYSAYKRWAPDGEDGLYTLYARFIDVAGNLSEPVQTSFVLDRQQPWGGVFLREQTLGQGVMTATLYLGWEDNLSASAQMRLSDSPDFTNTSWQPYTDTLHWSLDLAADQTQFELYVQYQDESGNLSDVFGGIFTLDTTPPDVFVVADAGEVNTRLLRIFAEDNASELVEIRISNDPLLLDGVSIFAFADTISWTFDSRQVAWVQVVDAAGNRSQPFPVYSELAVVLPAETEQKVFLPWVGRR